MGPAGLRDTRTAEGPGLLHHPTRAGMLPSFSVLGDVGLPGGRLKAGG